MRKTGPITHFSRKSQRRLVWTLRNAKVEWVASVTLTYPREYPKDGRVVKEHWDKFRAALVARWPGIKYLWVLEFQQRGAPHYHVLLSQWVPKKWVAEEWNRVVGGDEEHLRAGTRVEGVRGAQSLVRYLVGRYCGKKEQKEVPADFKNVGRFWGCSYGLAAPEGVMRVAREVGDRVARVARRELEKRLGKQWWLHGGRCGMAVFGWGVVLWRLAEWFVRVASVPG